MKISILIPCHNEEKSIKKCVQSCLNQSRKADEIVVVNDSSTDRSLEILKTFGKKIKIVNNISKGNKSYAQEEGLKYVTGDIFIGTDGDTVLDWNFVKNIEEDFKDEKVAAAGGYVRSIRYNWITIARAYDYSIGQNIHKLAQNDLNFMFVIPGAASAFRTKIFKKYINFDHDTLTEDLDFTYKLHEQGFKIKYDMDAIVYTQDPTKLQSYVNQMRRWYGGGWQNLVKHLNNNLISNPGRALELSLIYIEGLFFSVLLFLIPIVSMVFALKLLLVFEILIIAQSIFAALKEKRADILLVPFFYPALMMINGGIFLEQFIKVVIFRKINLIWFQPERVKI
jgi:cellulose synthase/poly-beta-1,6-N-acetylglucosamine synthase-like glycosyltransferase